jgi:hypothetical protein
MRMVGAMGRDGGTLQSGSVILSWFESTSPVLLSQIWLHIDLVGI